MRNSLKYLTFQVFGKRFRWLPSCSSCFFFFLLSLERVRGSHLGSHEQVCYTDVLYPTSFQRFNKTPISWFLVVFLFFSSSYFGGEWPTLQPGPGWNSWFYFLSLLSAEITCVHHCAQFLQEIFWGKGFMKWLLIIFMSRCSCPCTFFSPTLDWRYSCKNVMWLEKVMGCDF